MRKDNGDLFERFHYAVKVAIGERLRLNESKAPDELADEIREDVIDPELRRIRDRLHSVANSEHRKLKVGLGLGILATTVGLLAGTAPAAAGALGATTALAVAGPARVKRIDEESDISASDMYFLWRAVKEDHNQSS